MREFKRLSQDRRDFRADYKCEGCNHIEKNISGYDDSYFHTGVVPAMKCNKCGETTKSLNEIIVDQTTVPANVVM